MSTTSPSSSTYTLSDLIRIQLDVERRLGALERSVRDTRLQIAEQLDALAEDIGYPINDIAKTRKHIRELAAQLRSGVRHG